MPERNTPRRTGGYEYVEPYSVEAGAKCEAGNLIGLNAAGDARHADGTAGEIIVGRCEATADNAGGGAGDVEVLVRTGVFRWNNDVAGKQVTKAHIGDGVFAHDSETIRIDAKAGAGSKAGRLIAVDDQGAWVATGIPFLW